jgi:hypothetical protein
VLNRDNGVRTHVYRAPKKAYRNCLLRDKCALQQARRSGGARSRASKSHLRQRSSRRWPRRKQKKSTRDARRSPSSRTPGSNNAVVYGSSAVEAVSRPAWKRCGLVSATTSSAGSGCARAHMHNCKRLRWTTHPETSTSEPPRTHEPTPSRIQKPLLDRSNQFLHRFLPGFPVPGFPMALRPFASLCHKYGTVGVAEQNTSGRSTCEGRRYVRNLR